MHKFFDYLILKPIHIGFKPFHYINKVMNIVLINQILKIFLFFLLYVDNLLCTIEITILGVFYNEKFR